MWQIIGATILGSAAALAARMARQWRSLPEPERPIRLDLGLLLEGGDLSGRLDLLHSVQRERLLEALRASGPLDAAAAAAATGLERSEAQSHLAELLERGEVSFDGRWSAPPLDDGSLALLGWGDPPTLEELDEACERADARFESAAQHAADGMLAYARAHHPGSVSRCEALLARWEQG